MTKSLSAGEVLAEGVRFFRATLPSSATREKLLYRRILKRHHSGFDRDLAIEVTLGDGQSLVMRLRDTRTGEVVAESLPGQIGEPSSSAEDLTQSRIQRLVEYRLP